MMVLFLLDLLLLVVVVVIIIIIIIVATIIVIICAIIDVDYDAGLCVFQTLFIERTIMVTCSKLPGLLRWFEVESSEMVQLCPVEVAIDTMERMNTELRMLVMQYTSESSLSINPLTMRLNGVIDAAVQGGTAKYEEV